MYCTNCGKRNADDAAFCFNCGEPLRAAEHSVPDRVEPMMSSISESGYSYGEPSGSPERDGRAQRVFDVIKTILTSKLFLAFAVLMSVSFVASIASGFVQTNPGDNMLNEALTSLMEQFKEEGLLEVVPDIEPNTDTVTSAFSFSNLHELAALVGIWLLYFDARKKDSIQELARGMSILRILALITLIVVCVIFGIIVVLVLLALLSTIALAAPEATVLFSFILSILAAIAAFAIVYAAKFYQTIKSINSTMKTGVYDGKVSKFVAIVTIVFACISALSSLATLDITSVIAGVCSSAAFIILGVMLLQYRDNMCSLAENCFIQ